MKRSLGIVVVAGLLLTACQSMPSMPWQKAEDTTTTDVGLEPIERIDEAPLLDPGLLLSTEQRFADIPLPVGVIQDTERTFVFESGNLQIGRMVYTTKANVNELAQFYLKECPSTGWKRVNVMEADGVEIMFEKPGKRLLVGVRDLGMVRGNRVLVLLLTPEKDSTF